MEKGYLQGESVRALTPATIIWVNSESWESHPLAGVGGFAWSKSPRFLAYKSENCGTVELSGDLYDD